MVTIIILFRTCARFPGGALDIALDFNYHFLEHLHPGHIIHRFSGPRDVSIHFGDSLDYFQFEEWTYRVMREQLKDHGFKVSCLYRRGRVIRSPFARVANKTLEILVGLLPSRWRHRGAARLFQSVNLAARRLS